MIRDAYRIVPQPARIAAGIALMLPVLAGLFVGFHVSEAGHAPLVWAAFLGGGLFTGFFLAVWILGLGFVYVDAKRRGMRPVLWLIIAIFVPHLLGFLLYFALRQPIAEPCAQCGLPSSPDQRFCPNCGCLRTSSGIADGRPIVG